MHDEKTQDKNRPETADVSRRDLAARVLGALGVAVISACGSEAAAAAAVGPAPSGLSLADIGDDIKWVETVLGSPISPPSARTGDLASWDNSAAGIGATVVIAEGSVTAGDGGGGVFYWSNDTTTADDGGTVIVPNNFDGGLRTGCWKRVYDGPLNARWFGAVGDESDQTVAIKAAINALPSEGGTLYFPPGDYRFSSPLVYNYPCPTPGARANVTILGAGSRYVEAFLRSASRLIYTGAGSEAAIQLHGNYVRGWTFEKIGIHYTSEHPRGPFTGILVQIGIPGDERAIGPPAVSFKHCALGHYNGLAPPPPPPPAGPSIYCGSINLGL